MCCFYACIQTYNNDKMQSFIYKKTEQYGSVDSYSLNKARRM